MRTPRPIPEVRRLVVKVGTSSLVDRRGFLSSARLAKVARDLARVAAERSCVLVSSGAIAAGLAPVGLERRPGALARLQAAAAVGQGRLVAAYTDHLARRGLVAAQVLLTQEDFVRRRHFVNARRTFDELLSLGAVPVVNENDTVATEEIRFGDNDRLAALVAVMVRADLLVLLSDVDGIYTRDPGRPGARLLEDAGALDQIDAGGPRSAHGSGGMASKVQGARIASAAGVPTVVARASTRDVLARILAGERIGTWVPASARRERGRRAWVAFVATAGGRIHVDAGAERALRQGGSSLLAAGVVGAEGAFQAGDPVEVAGPGGAVFARGITNYSAAEIPRLAGRSSADLARLPGGPYDREVIHRDELVVIARAREAE